MVVNHYTCTNVLVELGISNKYAVCIIRAIVWDVVASFDKASGV